MTEDQARQLFYDHCQPGGRGALERNGERPAIAAILSLTQAAPDGWRPIETLSPVPGVDVLVWGKPCSSAREGAYVSRWEKYGVGSIAHELWKRGEGPEGAFWHVEPVNNWSNSWNPTHWSPIDLPAPPAQGAGSTASTSTNQGEDHVQADQ